MRRKAIGILAALLLLIGTITLFNGPENNSAAGGFAASCIRVGLVLGAIWLALPQIESLISKSPRWLLSWFIGKKTDPKSRDTPTAPTIRQPRPRRRSSA